MPPRSVYIAAQAVVGCLIAASVKSEIFASFFAEWPLFLGIVVATLMASSLLGYLISRWKVLPGTTAVWGSTPGAASAMVLMAEHSGPTHGSSPSCNICASSSSRWRRR